MFLESFPKGSYRLPNILLLSLQSVTLIPKNHLTHLCDGDGSLSLGSHREVFVGVASFELNLDAHFTTDLFETFTQPFGVKYHNLYLVGFLVPVCCLLWLLLLYLCLFFIVSLFSTHIENLGLLKGPLKCSFSFCNNSGFAQTVPALHVRMLNMVYSAERLW